MAIVLDPTGKRIVLDSATYTAKALYVAWVDWFVQGDNSKYLPAFRTAGGDDLGSGLSIPPYYFLINGWRVRPMETNHTLTIEGNLFVEGGGDPVVATLGTYQVLVKSVVPVQAQGISTSGTSAADIWNHPGRTLTDYSGVWSDNAAVTLSSKVDIATAILRNKTVTDPSTGVMTVYADDNTTPLYTAQLYESISTSTKYRGEGAQRRERLQ